MQNNAEENSFSLALFPAKLKTRSHDIECWTDLFRLQMNNLKGWEKSQGYSIPTSRKWEKSWQDNGPCWKASTKN